MSGKAELRDQDLLDMLGISRRLSRPADFASMIWKRCICRAHPASPASITGDPPGAPTPVLRARAIRLFDGSDFTRFFAGLSRG